MGDAVKILAFDLETSPNICFTWGLFNQNLTLDKIIEVSRVLCFSARWVDEPICKFYSEHTDGREKMLQVAHDLLSEADATLTFNGDKFDHRHLRREFALAGMSPPPPVSSIDLLKVARKQFLFQSNKLEHVATQFGVGAKVKHRGFSLWKECLNGDDDAWREMETYCIQDTDLLVDLYYKLLPWISPSHPSRGIIDSDDGCPTCGGTLRPRGYSYTRTGRFRRFVCAECSAWCRSTRRDDFTEITAA